MLHRACDFGMGFKEYFAAANEELVTMIQIETPQAVEQADAIAALDGADVLFIGPADLCASMGFVMDVDNPAFAQAAAKVVAACRRHGKAAGLLLRSPEQVQRFVDDGFTVIGVGSDGGAVRDGLRKVADAFKGIKAKQHGSQT
jgi:4-hydroxy-2-oxoheptanedioate aldolase